MIWRYLHFEKPLTTPGQLKRGNAGRKWWWLLETRDSKAEPLRRHHDFPGWVDVAQDERCDAGVLVVFWWGFGGVSVVAAGWWCCCDGGGVLVVVVFRCCAG